MASEEENDDNFQGEYNVFICILFCWKIFGRIRAVVMFKRVSSRRQRPPTTSRCRYRAVVSVGYYYCFLLVCCDHIPIVVNKLIIIMLINFINYKILWNYIIDARFSWHLCVLHSTQIYYYISFAVFRKYSSNMTYNCLACTLNVFLIGNICFTCLFWSYFLFEIMARKKYGNKQT